MKNIALYFMFLGLTPILAQTSSIKGLVFDKQSESPLEGATIELLNASQATGVITNFDGRFTLKDVSVGRRAIRVSFIGYEPYTVPNIEVTSGKDVFINIGLTEAFNQLDEVVLTTNTNKDKPINKLATVSTRQFGLEEVTRFSGGRSDVGRLAANFAGVSSPDDSRNDIVVRGNSPTGLLWRLEGIPIPSPNHFGTAGTTGSPVSALNPNMLKNSDFLTSAFPSEYGNAIGGVFDLGFRNGNIDDYEFTLQAGIFTGVEAMAEGPLGKKKGSFLIAGRYSLISLLGVGAGGTSATPNYSDLSFHLNFGKSNLGKFSVFGIMGNSDIEFLGNEISEDDLFAAEDENTTAESRFGVLGLKHQITLGQNSYLRSILSSSFSGNDFNIDRYIDKDTSEERLIQYAKVDNSETRFTFSTLYNSKLNNKNTLRIGVLAENFNVQYLLQDRNKQPDNNSDGDPDFFTFRDINENMLLLQPYAHIQFRLSEQLTINAGLHAQYSSLNEQFALEPRTSLTYQLAPNHTLNLGYGLHQQSVALPLLFLNEEINGQLVQTNKNLDFTRSNHYVLGYDVKLNSNWRGKVEVYYQSIDKAGVEPFPSSYSTLTEGANFIFDNNRVSLVNDGTGYNTGIEFTLEKFFSKGYYGLFTGSFFDSKYTASDGVERNSPFNNGYVVNLLGGKEFKVGRLRKNIFFIDTRFTTSGGRYYTPVDLEASQQTGFEVLQDEFTYNSQYDSYFRWDLKFGIKLNSKEKKRSHQVYLDLQNVTANENVFARRYNRQTNNIDQVNQIGFFPDFGYRYQF
jgi:hypothetical protein